MITRVLLTDFRNHEDKTLEFKTGQNMLVGPNGAGKTNVLEAIYTTFRGSSWRGKDETLVREEAEWARVELHDDARNEYVLLLDRREGNLKKTRQINKTNVRKGFPTVVLFEPEFIRTLTGSPERRRAWLDDVLSQTDVRYQNALKQFNRALRQRNSLLKRDKVSRDHIFVWNLKLAEFGALLSAARERFVTEHTERFTELYQTIAGEETPVGIAYQPQFRGDYNQSYLDKLAATEDRDRLLGFTSSGPHREDVRLTYGDAASHERMSRGEVRTTAITLKQIEFAALEKHTGKPPLLLLDDILSELDETRAGRIGLLNKAQIIATSTQATKDKSRTIITI